MNKQLLLTAWTRGLLSYKLKKHQQPVYKAVWNSINTPDALKYVINCSRRFGKTFTLCLVAIEFAIRNTGVQIRFAAPTAKSLRKIIYPIFKIILSDCPDSLKPQFKSQDDVIVFGNGSEIHLAGTDAGHSESLRGTASHLNILDEAGSMDELDYIMRSILMPQTLTTKGKTILASTPSVSAAHDYYTIYRECKEEGNVSEFTILDNTSLDDETIELFAKESGGRESTTWKREYLCQFVTDSDLAVIPEWNPQYTQQYEKDQYYNYYHKYVALDTGVRDFSAALFAVYDFRRATLHIEDEYTINGPEMTTAKLAKAIADKEEALWGKQKVNLRVADNNNLVIIQDMSVIHDLPFKATNKEKLEAMVNEVRMWVQEGRITIDPRCEMLSGAIQFAVWNPRKQQHEFARSKKYGHYDHLAALIYLVRNIDTFTNPVPMLHNTPQSTHWINKEMMQDRSSSAFVIENLFKRK